LVVSPCIIVPFTWEDSIPSPEPAISDVSPGNNVGVSDKLE
jgi:hypothetical protein